MAITRIIAPAKFTGRTEYGPVALDFIDGIAETDAELTEGNRAYFTHHGYTVEAPQDGEDASALNPSEHSVDDVLTALGLSAEEATPAPVPEVQRVLAAERDGKGRKTLLEALEAYLAAPAVPEVQEHGVDPVDAERVALLSAQGGETA